MKRITLALSIFLVCASSAKSQVADTAINNPFNQIAAPDFEATTIAGEEIRLSDFRGKTIVFNMWFTGCVPCVEEMPELNQLVTKYQKDSVVFLSVNWDKTEETSEFLSRHEFKFKVIPDRSDIIIKKYQGKFVVLPKTYIIDAKGILRKVFTGGNSVTDLDKYLEQVTAHVKE